MRSQPTVYGHAIVLDAGEEIHATLQAFAGARGLRAGWFTGIGAVGETELGFFLPATGTYARRVFRGDHEIGALIGNVSELDGAPFIHAHLMIAGPDFVAHAGHLFRAVVTVTCEVQLVSDPGVLARVRRPDLGFHPLLPADRAG